MLLVRTLVLLLLLGAIALFALYVATGERRWRTLGLRVLGWTLAAGFLFFGVLILQRVL
ncbi:MAG: hypothetical protein OJF60_000912 [Burkholderiaceae bacterium]|jgi:hypothetical protein|nr:MAG: hypothetical protein OJF60_000912 [Burkholderiaceae bacterium]